MTRRIEIAPSVTSLRTSLGLCFASLALAMSQPARADSECEVYAQTAVDAQQTNVQLGCEFTGPRWSADYDSHLSWCETQDQGSVGNEMVARITDLQRCEHSMRCAADNAAHPEAFAPDSGAFANQAFVTSDYTFPVMKGVKETVSGIPKIALRPVFDQAWAAAGQQMCQDEAAKPDRSAWHFCNPSTNTALFVSSLGNNDLGVTYVAFDTSFSFDHTTDTIFGSYMDPTIDVSFDLVLFMVVHLESEIDPNDTQPILTVVSADACISDASVNSENWAVSADRLRSEEDQLRDKNPDLSSVIQSVQAFDAQLRELVRALPQNNAGNRVFLSVGVNDAGIFLHFERRGGLAGSVTDSVSDALGQGPALQQALPDWGVNESVQDALTAPHFWP